MWAPYKYSFTLHDWSLLNRAYTMGLSGLHDIRNTNCVSFAVASEWTSVSYFGEEKRKKKEKKKRKKEKKKKKHTRGNPRCETVTRTHSKPSSFQCKLTTKPSVFGDSLFTLCKWMGMTGFIGGSCTSIIFVATNVFFSRQNTSFASCHVGICHWRELPQVSFVYAPV